MDLNSFKKLLAARGLILSEQIVKQLYADFDTSRNFKVDYEEFKTAFMNGSEMISPKKLNIDLRNFIKALNKTPEEAFKPFEPRSGKFKFSDFATALQGLNFPINYVEIENLFEFIDSDKSGEIDATELVQRLQIV